MEETMSEMDLILMIVGAAHAPIEDDPIGKLPEVVYVRLGASPPPEPLPPSPVPVPEG